MKNLYILAIFIMSIGIGFSQAQFPVDMEKTLSKMQLEYIPPVEKFPTFMESGEIRNFKYDFGLVFDDGDMMVLVQTRNDDGTYIPQVSVSGLVSTLATNRQEFDIRVMGTGDAYLKATNSDWAIESLFIPKKVMTEYKVAYLKALFKEGVGAVNILYLSKEEIKVFPIVRYADN